METRTHTHKCCQQSIHNSMGASAKAAQQVAAAHHKHSKSLARPTKQASSYLPINTAAAAIDRATVISASERVNARNFWAESETNNYRSSSAAALYGSKRAAPQSTRSDRAAAAAATAVAAQRSGASGDDNGNNRLKSRSLAQHKASERAS